MSGKSQKPLMAPFGTHGPMCLFNRRRHDRICGSPRKEPGYLSYSKVFRACLVSASLVNSSYGPRRCAGASRAGSAPWARSARSRTPRRSWARSASPSAARRSGSEDTLSVFRLNVGRKNLNIFASSLACHNNYVMLCYVTNNVILCYVLV